MNSNNTSWKAATDADGILWLTLDKPGTSANVLSSDVLVELDTLLRPLQQSPPRGVVVVSAKKSGFIAGADIKEFTGITDAESGYRLIHQLVTDQEQLQAAARDFVLRRPPPRKASFGERILSSALVRPFVRRALIAQVAAKARPEHYPAPYAIIDLWARYGAHGAEAFEGEARSIAQLFTTETSRNLVRVFLLQDRLKALGGKAAADIKHVHVVGAGVMGGDIAAWSALRGFTVTLQAQSLKLVGPAVQRAQELFKRR